MKSKFLWLLLTLASVNLFANNQWLTDYKLAVEKAKKENKAILIDFTGSDWCSWCIKLEKDLLGKGDFTSFASQHLVLFKADFPRTKKLTPVIQKQNDELASKYGVQGFPYLVILSPNEEKLGEISGYPGGTVTSFIESIKKILKK